MSAMKMGSLVLAATMVVVATGCGGGGRPGAAPAPPSTASPATVAVTTPRATASSSTVPAAGLPEGTYRTAQLSLDQLVATGLAAGFSQADIDPFVAGGGVKRSAVMTLRLAQGGWTLLEGLDGQPGTVGWEGSYQVVDDHTVVAKDSCGAITYGYVVHGDQLDLRVVHDSCPGVGELVAQTIIYQSGPFTRVDGTHGGGAGATYSSQAFVLPFDVSLPAWLPAAPKVDEPNLVTWDATDANRAVRILVPVNVYVPGATTATAPPADYLAYLLGQSDHGAHFADVTKTTVAGLAATIVTATTDQSLDGSLGCSKDGTAATDCFGLQPDLVLRIAVVPVGDKTLLVWLRNTVGVDETAQLQAFETMLASIRLR